MGFNPRGVLFWSNIMAINVCLAFAYGPKFGAAAFFATSVLLLFKA